MTVETTVKYSPAIKDVNFCSSTSTVLAVAHPSNCTSRPIKDDHYPMSPRIWLPCKSRVFALCILTFACFFCFTLYTGVVTPSAPCFVNEIIQETPTTRYPLIRDRIKFPRLKRRLPQCIIIGCKKGGTRALLEYINLHPRIKAAALEMHFFDNDDKYEFGLEWYRRHMPFSSTDQITVEKSPAYFITEAAPARIRAMNESIKLLLLVRDPVIRVISDYAQLYSNKLKKGKETETFEDLVLNPDGEVNIDYKAIRISMYDVHLANWLNHFTLDQIHIVNGDRLITNPIAELRLIEDFLGLKHQISPENIQFNKTKGFFCLKNETSERCLSDSKGRKHPNVNPRVIRKLRRFYRQHNRNFYEMIGKNFGWPVD